MLRWAIESEAGCQAAKEESVATLCSAGSRTDTPDVRTLEYNGVVSFEHHKRSQPVNAAARERNQVMGWLILVGSCKVKIDSWLKSQLETNLESAWS